MRFVNVGEFGFDHVADESRGFGAFDLQSAVGSDQPVRAGADGSGVVEHQAHLGHLNVMEKRIGIAGAGFELIAPLHPFAGEALRRLPGKPFSQQLIEIGAVACGLIPFGGCDDILEAGRGGQPQPGMQPCRGALLHLKRDHGRIAFASG